MCQRAAGVMLGCGAVQSIEESAPCLLTCPFWQACVNVASVAGGGGDIWRVDTGASSGVGGGPREALEVGVALFHTPTPF